MMGAPTALVIMCAAVLSSTMEASIVKANSDFLSQSTSLQRQPSESMQAAKKRIQGFEETLMPSAGPSATFSQSPEASSLSAEASGDVGSWMGPKDIKLRETTREFLKTLKLCAPCKKYARLGENFDGGYVMCEDGLDEGLVGAYSYGINGVDGWGMAFASRYSVPLNEYDCTNPLQPAVCPGCTVKFHNECILNNNAPQDSGNRLSAITYKTLGQQLQDAGNSFSPDRSLVLKIDVENAEWSIFAEEPVENLKKFRQILVEYHGLSKLNTQIWVDLYLVAAKNLQAAGFAVTHLHGNNNAGFIESRDYSIPDVLEVTYIQKPAAGCSADIPYHIPVDQPNVEINQELPDAHLPSMLQRPPHSMPRWYAEMLKIACPINATQC